MTHAPNLQSKLYTEFDDDHATIISFIQWLTDIYELPTSPRVLDIGCGPGKMLPEYDRLGWHVTGMEPDPDFFRAASEVATSCENVNIVRGGFLELDAENEYDLILAIDDPFAYLLEIHQRVDALFRICRALRPGGVLFLELKNFLYKLRHYEPYTEETSDVNGKSVVHLMQHEIDFHNARWIHRDEYIVEGESKIVAKEHCLAIISPPELMYFIEQQGFSNIQTFNSYEARESEPLNGRLMMISARKSALLSHCQSAELHALDKVTSIDYSDN
jgi:SAM-dependent methyltransferase